MVQKTYIFPGTTGSPVTKTLATPTNERIVGFLNAIGVKSFSELVTDDGSIKYGLFVLDLPLDQEKLKQTLGICLVESVDDIDFSPDKFDSTISDDAVQDFFDQRARKFVQRMNNIPLKK
jgi:hypothetical protein